MPHKFPKFKEGRDPHMPVHRSYFITIDTHVPESRIIGPLWEVWNYIMSNLNLFLVEEFRGTYLLEDPTGYANVERSKNRHSIHIHGYVTTYTNGFSDFDLNKLNAFVNQNLRQVEGFKRSNILVRYVKGSSDQDYILNYSSKEDISEERESGRKFKIIPPS